MLAKLAALAVVVWFYFAAEKHNQSPITWPLIGIVGYWLTYVLADTGIDALFPNASKAQSVANYLVLQTPVLCAVFASYLIKGKLVHDAQKPANVEQNQQS